MAKLQELPQAAQDVLLKLGTWRTVYQLVDELGWSQTEIQKWLNRLVESKWVETKITPDASPMGGSATAYRRAEAPTA